MKTLEFNNNIATLDLSTLERTASYEMAKGGLPKNRPIEHFKLVTDLQSNIKKNTKLESKIDVIYTSERQTMQIMHNKADGECPIEKYLLQRVVTKLLISDESKEFQAAVGVSYTDRGIQLVFGTHVNVCSNLMIWGPNFMSTYGTNKVGFSIMMDAFDDWMKRFQEKRSKDMEIIEALQKRKVEENELFEVLGRLIHAAEKNNSLKSDDSSLNVSQTLRLIDNYENRDLTKKTVTAWDITNWGTNNLKPDQDGGDLTSIYNTTHKFSNVIAKHLIPEINLN
tara:strand:- start:1346 stop:2191 length:846 start_codon:yes stop_codon:yes gene_type:complete